MSDDLVKRLRKYCPCKSDIGCADDLCAEAANRIEELESMQECACAYDYPNDICAFHRRLFERVTTARYDRIEQLEAALINCMNVLACFERPDFFQIERTSPIKPYALGALDVTRAALREKKDER